MFLNLPSRNKRLTLEYALPRSRSYLSNLNDLNKEKSFSTAALKEEFKQFKNKSLSHSVNNHLLNFQQKNRPVSPVIKTNSCSKYMNGKETVPLSKLTDFKKSYLNLDSKLSKSTKPKDYFKPLQQSLTLNQYNNQHNFSPVHSSKPKNQPQSYPSTYLQVQKRLQEETNRRELLLLTELNNLKQMNQFLKKQNQELKKQRSIDLELIARQNQVMQKQQELIEANQQTIHTQKINSQTNNNTLEDSNAYTFANGQRFQRQNLCSECSKRNKLKLIENRQQKVEKQFLELKIQKIQEEKTLMKKQIHQLVYQSEKLKQLHKKIQEKYQKQLQHNQKLLKIIENINQPEYRPEQDKNQSSYQVQQSKSMNRQPYLNFISSKDSLQHDGPISIKKDQINEFKQNKYQSQINSPLKKFYEKSAQYKSAANLIKFNDRQDKLTQQQRTRSRNTTQQSKIKTYFKQKQNMKFNEIQRQRQKEMLRQKQRQLQRERQKLRKLQKQRQKQNLQWCQNQNILKYLNEINKQKIKEIDQIQSILKEQ